MPMDTGAKTRKTVSTAIVAAIAFFAAMLAVPLVPSPTAQADPQLDGPTPVPYSERWRFGVGVDGRYGNITDFDVTTLGAGWYSDWSTSVNPTRPGGIEYVQVISVKDTRYPPDWADLAQKIVNNQGAVWIVGNEPDCRWEDCNERLPEEYATIYHEVYTFIKGQDPTAQVAIAGVSEATPLRMLYLTKVWDSYQQQFSDTMPIDIFTVHEHILKEGHSWDPGGTGIPPGISPEEEGEARQYTIADNDNLDIFIEHIVRYRQWMNDRGQQNKPLYISEYGVIFPPEYPFGITGDRVSAYMTNTFNFLLYASDPALGYPADDYHLVQRWLWFSINSPQHNPNTGKGFNGALFDWQTRQLSPFGWTYMRYLQGWNRATPTPSTTPGPGWVYREAEAATQATPLATAEDATVSACYYLDSPVFQPGGRATFGAKLSDGDYELWGRVRAPSDTSNAFLVWVDSEQAPPNPEDATWNIPVNNDWSWQPVSFDWGQTVHQFSLANNPQSGQSHTFVFLVREGGVQLDAVRIARVGAPPPSGLAGCVPPPTATPSPTTTPSSTPTVTRTPMPAGPAYIRGQVTYEGRGTPPAANWARPLQIGVHLPGDPIPAYRFDTLPDTTGAFTVGGVISGTFDVSARNDHSLRNLWRDFFADVGLNVVDLDRLREGDASGDNFVDISDFSLLRSAFFKAQGEPGFDPRADFNEDDFVDISDFSLLRGNFFEAGDIVLNPSGGVQAQGLSPYAPAAPVTIYFSPGAQTVNTGQLGFTVEVWVNPAGQEIDAVQAEVIFDAGLLDAISVVCNSSYFDTTGAAISSGNVRVGCTLKTGFSPPTTTLRAATITFNAKTSSGTTTLTFGGLTKVTGPGVSEGYPLTKQSGSVTVQEPTPTPTPTDTPVSMNRTFTGHVYGADQAHPVADGEVQLYGSNSAGSLGAWLKTATTLADGSFTLRNDSSYTYYNIYLRAEAWPDYAFHHAVSASGGVPTYSNWIQFTSPGTGTYAGNDFFVTFTGPTPTATATPGTPTVTSTATTTPGTPTVTSTPTATVPPGSSAVCTLAFNDLDANSQQDGGEGLLNGAFIELLDLSYQVLDAYTTDGSEPYCFPGRGDGTYLVRFTAPNGFLPTTATLWGVSVTGGGSVTVPFGARFSAYSPTPTPTIPAGTGRIEGVVYNDANQNMTRDTGEDTLHGARIRLQDQAGHDLAEYWTGSDGRFQFSGIAEGTYRLIEDDPAGYFSSTPNTMVVGVVSQFPTVVNYGDYEPARPFKMHLPLLRKPDGGAMEFRWAHPLSWGL